MKPDIVNTAERHGVAVFASADALLAVASLACDGDPVRSLAMARAALEQVYRQAERDAG